MKFWALSDVLVVDNVLRAMSSVLFAPFSLSVPKGEILNGFILARAFSRHRLAYILSLQTTG